MSSPKSMAASTEDYLGAVREHLTINGASPDRVGEHLEEIAGHLQASGASPVAEFGPPDVVAQQLASADRTANNPWVRIPALTLGLAGWALAFLLLLDGNENVSLTGIQLGSLAMIAAVGAFGFSTAGAKFRDRLVGVSTSRPSRNWIYLGKIVGLALGATALSIAIELLVGDWSVGLGSVRSWVAGLAVAVALTPVTWWAYRRNLGRPKFPSGSPLRASILTRHVRVAGRDDEGWRVGSTGLQSLVPMAGVLALILSARWLSEPYDLIALGAAVLVGPGWLFWLRRTRAAETGSTTT